MGKAHMVAFSNMPKLFTDAPFIPVFKTVCDIVPEIAEDFKERYGFEKACTDWMDIINDPEIDIVSVCTPNSEHAAVSIAALKAGKHVICENRSHPQPKMRKQWLKQQQRQRKRYSFHEWLPVPSCTCN